MKVTLNEDQESYLRGLLRSQWYFVQDSIEKEVLESVIVALEFADRTDEEE
jgi:hypothetical protein